jgi:hypothetical protein
VNLCNWICKSGATHFPYELLCLIVTLSKPTIPNYPFKQDRFSLFYVMTIGQRIKYSWTKYSCWGNEFGFQSVYNIPEHIVPVFSSLMAPICKFSLLFSINIYFYMEWSIPWCFSNQKTILFRNVLYRDNLNIVK